MKTKLLKLRVPKWVVAHWCNPEIKRESASRNLRRDIVNIPGMLARLQALGYHRSQRHFTYAQALVLTEHYCGEARMEQSTQVLWAAYSDRLATQDMP